MLRPLALQYRFHPLAVPIGGMKVAGWRGLLCPPGQGAFLFDVDQDRAQGVTTLLDLDPVRKPRAPASSGAATSKGECHGTKKRQRDPE
jgi:hypothetical protein